VKENITNYGSQIKHHHFTSYTLSGVLADTILTVDQEVFSVGNRSGGGASGIHPFSYTFDYEDNIYMLFDRKYRIRKYNSKGKLKLEFNRDYNSVALSNEEKKNYRGEPLS